MQIHKNMRHVIQALALAAVTMAQGCLGGATEPVNATGSFTLQSVNGAALPYTFSNGTTLKSEILSLKADGTFSDNITRVDNTTSVDVGNYTVFGTGVSFADITLSYTYQGTLEGNRLTINFGTVTEVFVRP